MIVNVRYGKDLITVDLRVSQIRYLHNVDRQGLIEFIPLSHDDVWGYESLFESDKNLFLKSLVEDVYSNLGIRLVKKNLKFV